MSPICQAVADGTELQTQIVLHKLLHTEVCTLLPIVTGHQIPAKLLIFLLSGLDVGKKEVPEWYLVLFRSFPSPLLHKFLDSHACIVIRTVSATYRYGVPQKGSYGMAWSRPRKCRYGTPIGGGSGERQGGVPPHSGGWSTM